MRQPIAADRFYSGNSEKLKNEIKECFLGEFGPKKLPGKQDESIFGVIAPHAGYPYSGQCQAWSYLELPKNKVFIILGTDHNGLGTCLSEEDWETPLGVIKNNKGLTMILEKRGIPINNRAHGVEHSIEVQLPFLQYICGEVSFVPINVSHDKDLNEITEAIFKSIEEFDQEVIIICSGDFTHYGKSYGYVPFKENVKEELEKLDKKAIDFIINLDSKGLLDYIEKTGATICGSNGYVVFIEICKLLGAQNLGLKQYYTSGEISDDFSNCVGYASIIAQK